MLMAAAAAASAMKFGRTTPQEVMKVTQYACPLGSLIAVVREMQGRIHQTMNPESGVYVCQPAAYC